MRFVFTAWVMAAALAIAAETPSVENAIPDAVKVLGEPANFQFQGGITMAVTAATEKAQAHVLQGMNHLDGGWEFEASRHFAAAMKEDPECLLAHWGMVMCLLSPSPENGSARIAVTDRLLSLIEQGKGNDLERGYAYGLAKYIEDGPAAAAAAFRNVSKRFPNDLQVAVLAALFGRSGYDDYGTPTPDQEKAEASLTQLIAKFPDSPIPLHALLVIRAEAPLLGPSLELARKLTLMAPGYAPYFHLLGHYEWRCGEHGKASSSFGRALTLFDQWRDENKATIADCPEWVISECYRVVAIASSGDFETAYAAARRVAEVPLPAKRPFSPGARALLWEAKTLPARLLMKRGLPGNTTEALNSLPKPEELKGTREQSLAFWWIDGLRLALDAERLAQAGNQNEAMITAAALAKHGESMSHLQKYATRGGERSAWNRAFHALEVLASELNGRIALAGKKEAQGSAYNWFRSATDRQRPASMLYPPPVLAPMASRVGEYFLIAKRPKDAVEAFNEALAALPNDIDTMKGLQRAYSEAGMKKEAEDTAARVEKLEAQ